MLLRLRNRHFLFLDLLLLAITPALALGLRVNLPWDRAYGPALALYTLLALLVKLPVFWHFGFYRHYWRYASISEMNSILLGVGVTTVLVTGATFLFQGVGDFGATALPRSVPLIDGILTLLVVAGSRFSVRALEHRRARRRGTKSKRALIVGAGSAGQMVVREMLSSQHIAIEPIGFVDDDPNKRGVIIHGVRVLGPLAELPELVESYRIQEVIIAMPTAPGTVIRRVVRACEQASVPSRIVPGIYELLNGRVNISRLREVEIGDLLRREPVQVELSQVRRLLEGKRVLVTGAGGSIGSELCAQIAACRPSQMVVVGHGENSLYKLERRLMAQGYPAQNLRVVVADVRHRRRLERVFAACCPEIVFHAAAHKHVPLMESNLEDAITNNVLGTWNVVRLAQDYDVGRFVLISTDKAVNPVNVMGMTKRLAELIVHYVAAEAGRPYVSVRFGNVLGSRGSVVPLFKRQIAAGGPVTVTHPEMVRFFMTIPEAVQLVLQASALGKNGELFVLDMGEPVRIADLARDMIELSGLKVGEDIQIEYTGLRPGERLYEKLFTDTEKPQRSQHEKIFIVTCDGCQPVSGDFPQQVEALFQLALNGEGEAARQLLRALACGGGPAPLESNL